MSASDISVIVRSCGRPKLLERAITSIRTQSSKAFEIVIVAIGPEGAAALSGVKNREKTQIVSVEAGRKRGAALNDGIRTASGRWIAFLDDDDTWAPTFLEEMMSAIVSEEANSSVGGVVCQTELVYERYRNGIAVNCGRKPFNPRLRRIDAHDMAEANQFTINAVVWHQRVFSAVGYYREDLNLLEDWEFNMRAARNFQLRVVPRFLARYHRRPPDDPAPNTHRSENDSAARVLQATWAQIGGGAGIGPEGLTLRNFRRVFKRLIIRIGSWIRWRFR
jgi:glycosyltransferase involved in cell wall biosynthesis